MKTENVHARFGFRSEQHERDEATEVGEKVFRAPARVKIKTLKHRTNIQQVAAAAWR